MILYIHETDNFWRDMQGGQYRLGGSIQAPLKPLRSPFDSPLFFSRNKYIAHC